MLKMRNYIIIALAAFCIGSCQSCKSEKKPLPKKSESAYGTITGVVRMKGNLPHTSIVIAGSYNNDAANHTYYVLGPKRNELQRFVFKKIAATGAIKIGSLRLAGASGKSIERRTIRVDEYTIIE